MVILIMMRVNLIIILILISSCVSYNYRTNKEPNPNFARDSVIKSGMKWGNDGDCDWIWTSKDGLTQRICGEGPKLKEENKCMDPLLPKLINTDNRLSCVSK